MLHRLVDLAIATALAAALAVSPTSASATVPPGTAAAVAADPSVDLPSEVPSTRTPGVLDGNVQRIAQVGSTMIAGGTFTTVAEPMGGQEYARTNLFAFDATTAAVSQTFVPRVDGPVETLLPGPVPGTVYVAGGFTTVDGATASHVVLLDVATGDRVEEFRPAVTNGSIQTLALHENRLYVGGYFTKAGGVDHGGFAALDATTGDLDPFVDLQVSEHHNDTGSGAQGAVGVRELQVTPEGSRMVAMGNFKRVDGLDRDQLVVVDLFGSQAAVALDWQTDRYKPYCFKHAFDSYMRGLDMSPDGSWFVVTTTGGANSGSLCDTAARWETFRSGTSQQPSWDAHSGGDTTWGVAATDSVVYVGGHQRWMNNNVGRDNARQGAVPRAGLSAHDAQTGVPVDWNPGRNPRGVAAFHVLPTEAGVWIASDTIWIGDRRYRRPRLAFFAYDNGRDLASTATGRLPGTALIGGSDTSSGILYRINAGGPAIGSTDSGPDWSADNGADSTLRTSGSSSATWTPVPTVDSTVPTGTPRQIFDSERWDSAGGTALEWDLPVASGTEVEVRLYFANRCGCTSAVGSRTFDVAVEGTTVLDDYDIVTAVGDQTGTMRTFDVVSDGTIDIDFAHVANNPLINGIEVLVQGAIPSASESATSVWFDGRTTSDQQTVATPGLDWSTVRGATMIGGDLFYGSTDRYLHKRSFDGTTFGPDVRIDPYNDPDWAGVDTGSGSPGNGDTYDGVVPALYGDLNNVTGMAYADGRLYYTRLNDATLYWQAFVPDSGIISPVRRTLTGAFDWRRAGGMFIEGDDLYVVDRTDGSLRQVSLLGGAPVGTAVVVNSPATGGTDWRGRAVFLSTVAPEAQNQAPQAAFEASCVDGGCSFDASGSRDPDGDITSYSWSFGDDGTGAGATVEHAYADSGSYEVTLTVVDDRGASDSTSRTVTATVSDESPVDFVADAAVARTGSSPWVVVPGSAAVGDRLVLMHSMNRNDRTVSAPTGVTDWTQVGNQVSRTMRTVAWTKVVAGGDAGARVDLPMSGGAKSTVQVAVYRGVASGQLTVASEAETNTSADRSTPNATAPAGAWVLSYWASKSPNTTAWTAAPEVTSRSAAFGSGPGHIASLLADSGAPAPAGTYGGRVATSDATSSTATTWTVVLPAA
ncbi:MAG: PKD domain-containing protein [Actinomycetota bacterium]|nr:PKD domain-containing protein [Actinomycetota bacterium]